MTIGRESVKEEGGDSFPVEDGRKGRASISNEG